MNRLPDVHVIKVLAKSHLSLGGRLCVFQVLLASNQVLTVSELGSARVAAFRSPLRVALGQVLVRRLLSVAEWVVDGASLGNDALNRLAICNAVLVDPLIGPIPCELVILVLAKVNTQQIHLVVVSVVQRGVAGLLAVSALFEVGYVIFLDLVHPEFGRTLRALISVTVALMGR